MINQDILKVNSQHSQDTYRSQHYSRSIHLLTLLLAFCLPGEFLEVAIDDGHRQQDTCARANRTHQVAKDGDEPNYHAS